MSQDRNAAGARSTRTARQLPRCYFCGHHFVLRHHFVPPVSENAGGHLLSTARLATPVWTLRTSSEARALRLYVGEVMLAGAAQLSSDGQGDRRARRAAFVAVCPLVLSAAIISPASLAVTTT
jgi:hypothetical protein